MIATGGVFSLCRTASRNGTRLNPATHLLCPLFRPWVFRIETESGICANYKLYKERDAWEDDQCFFTNAKVYHCLVLDHTQSCLSGAPETYLQFRLSDAIRMLLRLRLRLKEALQFHPFSRECDH